MPAFDVLGTVHLFSRGSDTAAGWLQTRAVAGVVPLAGPPGQSALVGRERRTALCGGRPGSTEQRDVGLSEA